MKSFIPLAAILAVATAGVSQVSVRLPFLNPAGVTYVGGHAPVGLAAGPYAEHLTYGAQPTAYAAHPAAYAAHPTPYGTHHAFAAPLAHQVASVHHVPGVADVPVTHLEATPGVVQKLVDVAHPAVSTRKFHVRRPAIQKQFYDIEERVVVRPAGSALVELDEPISKVQRGPALISRALHPVHPVHPIHALHGIHTIPQLSTIHAIPTIPSLGVAPSAPSGPSAPSEDVPSSPAPSQQPSQDSFNDQDSVSVENPELRSAFDQQDDQEQQQQQDQQQQDQQQQQPEQQQQQQQQQSRQQQQQPQQQQRQQQQQQSPEQLIANFQSQIRARQQSFTPQFRQFLSEREQYEARQFQFQDLAQQQFQSDPIPQQQQRNQPAPQTRQFQQEQQQQQASQGQTEARFGSLQQEDRRSSAVEGRSVFPSLRNLDHASSQANQQRLIDLLTARGGVAEVGFGRSGPASGANVEAGGVRARVISATPAPSFADPAGERVSTRRVVVSRPVETLQELDVVEPATKLERVAVNTPTIFKTARLGVARVPTSYPVIQKTYAPAPVPLYGKTLAHPGFTYY